MSFFPVQDIQRQTAVITGHASPGFWLVADSLGRPFTVASGEQWRRGDTVAVIGGQIVGRAGKKDNPKTYEV